MLVGLATRYGFGGASKARMLYGELGSRPVEKLLALHGSSKTMEVEVLLLTAVLVQLPKVASLQCSLAGASRDRVKNSLPEGVPVRHQATDIKESSHQTSFQTRHRAENAPLLG